MKIKRTHIILLAVCLLVAVAVASEAHSYNSVTKIREGLQYVATGPWTGNSSITNWCNTGNQGASAPQMCKPAQAQTPPQVNLQGSATATGANPQNMGTTNTPQQSANNTIQQGSGGATGNNRLFADKARDAALAAQAQTPSQVNLQGSAGVTGSNPQHMGTTNTTHMTSPTDCKMSRWSSWSECSTTCGPGTRTSTRTIITHPKNGGKACPSTVKTKTCNNGPCHTQAQAQDNIHQGSGGVTVPNPQKNHGPYAPNHGVGECPAQTICSTSSTISTTDACRDDYTALSVFGARGSHLKDVCNCPSSAYTVCVPGEVTQQGQAQTRHSTSQLESSGIVSGDAGSNSYGQSSGGTSSGSSNSTTMRSQIAYQESGGSAPTAQYGQSSSR